MKKIIQLALILIMIISCSMVYAAKMDHYALGDIVSIGRYRDPNDAYSLAQAKTTIGSENKQLVINESITLYDDCNMPDNIAIKVTPNGLITATHADIIIHGPFEGPLSQCFALDANSSVTFRDGSIKEQCPLWYSSGGFTDTTLTAAITALGSAHWTLNISRGTWVIDADLTFAANTCLKFEGGAVFDIDANTTVTINGDVDAGLYQIFDLEDSGDSVVYGRGSTKEIYTEWYGSDPTGAVDSIAAFNGAMASVKASHGGIIQLIGKYKLDSTWTSSAFSGLTIKGVTGNLDASDTKKTYLDFTAVDANTVCIDFDDVNSLEMSDFYVHTGVISNTTAIEITDCTGLTIKKINIESAPGSTGYGLKLGGTAVADSVLVGSVENCLVQSTGTPYYLGYGTTSTNIENCYALGAATYGYHMYGCTYCELSGCAADTGIASDTAWGYGINSCSNIVMTACGAENNKAGHTKVFGGTVGLTMIDPRGVGNNTADSKLIGSLVDIGATGVNYNITIINPRETEVDPNNTTRGIWGRANTLHTTIINLETSSAMKSTDYITDVVGGDTTWMATYVSAIGGGYNALPNLTTSSFNYGADTAADDDYIVTIDRWPLKSYVKGTPIYFDANNANTGVCTLNVNGLGAKTIQMLHNQNTPDDYIEAGSMVHVIYDGTYFQLQTPDANP